jgi:hypothetical protein
LTLSTRQAKLTDEQKGAKVADKKIPVPGLNEDGEVVLELANGYSLRSGGQEFTAGEYVRLVDSTGEEALYWDQQEWESDPALVMGAIINAAITAPAEFG